MSDSVTVATKVCKKCLRELSVDQFYTAPDTRDGRRGGCKNCDNAASRAYYADNVDRAKRYAQAHSERIVAYRKRRYESDKVRIAAVVRAWAQANPDRVTASVQKYHAQKIGASIGVIPTDIKAQLIALYGPTCMAPGCESIDPELDHIVPLSKGGAHAVDNFQLLCRSCNSSKGNRSSADYRPVQV